MQKLRKRFGQHLLIDQDTIANIVQSINPSSGQILCEIGPGKGAITIPILKSVKSLHAIEIDRDLATELRGQCKDLGELNLHETDVLDFDFNQLGNTNNKVRVFGNLPYNISTPLLFHLMNYSDIISDMHFMLQKEVVDRITAKPNTSEYSRLSVTIQSFYKTQSLFNIPPEMFTPPPKVMSAFMRLTPDIEIQTEISDHALFNTIVETAFRHRRKTIKNNLITLASESQLYAAGIKPTQRPQEISIQQFIELSNILYAST